MIKWLEKNRIVSVMLTILIALEIFYFSSIPGDKFGAGGIIDVSFFYHIIVFFLFNFFLLISIKGDKKISIGYLLIALSISLLYSGLDEIHQMFVPYREAAIKDVLTDMIGVFSSTLVYFYSKKSWLS